MECTITVTAQAAFNDEVKIYVDMQAQIFSVFKACTVPIYYFETDSGGGAREFWEKKAISKRVVIQLGCTHCTSDDRGGIMRIAVGYTLTVQVSKFYALALTFGILCISAHQAFRPLTGFTSHTHAYKQAIVWRAIPYYLPNELSHFKSTDTIWSHIDNNLSQDHGEIVTKYISRICSIHICQDDIYVQMLTNSSLTQPRPIYEKPAVWHFVAMISHVQVA